MSENKTGRYLKYAIGEIILVVIGILIALQINNWNEDRVNKIKENAILRDLNSEFKVNDNKLDSIISYHKKLIGATQKLLSLMGKKGDKLNRQNIDSLLYLTLDYRDYSPSQSVIAELISSGKTNLISSDVLRVLIFEWVSAIDEKKEGYNTLDDMCQNQTLPYITLNGSMKNIDIYGLGRINGGSNFEFNNNVLFQEIEFENHIDNQFWGLTNYLEKLYNLQQINRAMILKTQ